MTRAAVGARLPATPALVVGSVRHTRLTPIRRDFSNRHYQWLIDLDSPPQPSRLLAPLGDLRPEDHLDGPMDFTTLKSQVLQRVADGGLDSDRVRRVLLLAHARILGHAFDPMSVFWCLDESDALVAALIEVRNTYGGRQVYVARPDAGSTGTTGATGNTGTTGTTLRDGFAKELFVSPFNDTTGRYAVRLNLGEDKVLAAVRLDRDGRPVFTAQVSGAPIPATTANLLRTAATHPLMTQQVSAFIRAHGIALWVRRLPLYTRAAGGPYADRPERVGRRGVLAQRLVHRAVRDLPITLRYPDGTRVGAGGDADPVLEIVRPAAAFARIQAHPKIGIGDGYVAGDWTTAPGTDLADAFAPFAQRLGSILPQQIARFRRIADRAIPEATRNSRAGARANISAHYDLGNDLFAGFLDESMTYSSALFDAARPVDDQDLTAAQHRKIDRALDGAGVGPWTRLLEIGTGWGELALRAARRGAEVTTITLSAEQAALATERIAAADLTDRVTVSLTDYREVTGSFDAIVSIEMLEAVGEEYWPRYFQVLRDRLAPGGSAVVQTILMDHERLLATRNSHGWIQERIFPGGLIPSKEALLEVIDRHTDLAVVDDFRFGKHYAHTLRRWRTAFAANWPRIPSAADESFRRTWEFYLAYSEAGFATGYLDVSQLTLRRPR